MKKQSSLKGHSNPGFDSDFNAGLAAQCGRFSGIVSAGISTTFVERVSMFLDGYTAKQCASKAGKITRGGVFFAL
jgi:hypothetical protein